MKNKLRDLEIRWYAALETGHVDYSVYRDKAYVEELDKCYRLYSSGYLKSIAAVKERFGRVKTVVDLGGGTGRTAESLRSMFRAKVYATEFYGSVQFKLLEAAAREAGFWVLRDFRSMDRKATLVFASEYFEHFANPLEECCDVLMYLKPKYLIIANSFNSRAIGHFNTYKCYGIPVEPKSVGRLFNKYLRRCHYHQIDFGFWNNRPTCWERDES